MTRHGLLPIVLLTATLTSCSQQALLPDGDNTIALYGGGAGVRAPVAVRPVVTGPVDLRGYSRTEADALAVRFPLLPNPILTLYVLPHLSAAGAPVPGYVTTYRLYAKDEYALPGE